MCFLLLDFSFIVIDDVPLIIDRSPFGNEVKAHIDTSLAIRIVNYWSLPSILKKVLLGLHVADHFLVSLGLVDSGGLSVGDDYHFEGLVC